MVYRYVMSESSSKENLTDAEVSGYRMQRQRERHQLEDILEVSGCSVDTKDTREDNLQKDKHAEQEMLSTV